MSPLNLDALIAANAARWPSMVIDFDAIALMNQVAARLIAPAAKDRYKSLFAQTGVPWPVIAMIHQRECSQRWDLSIAQGDPWDAVSVHVPAGRGPFGSWEEAAVDALTNSSNSAVPMSRWQHWDTIEGVLTRLEMYNGTGYFQYHDCPSPYVWSRTDQYVSGKYVSDGNFDGTVVDSQMGCAPLLTAMMLQDSTIVQDFPTWAAAPAQPSLTGADGVVHDTAWLQTTLNQLGATPQLKVDGGWGPNTQGALKTYQAGAGLAASGRYNVPTLNSLQAALAAAATAV